MLHVGSNQCVDAHIKMSQIKDVTNSNQAINPILSFSLPIRSSIATKFFLYFTLSAMKTLDF